MMPSKYDEKRKEYQRQYYYEHIEERKAYRRWYEKNHKEKMKQKDIRKKAKYRLKVLEYIRNKFGDNEGIIRCRKCGINITGVINWHHTNPDKKEHNISELRSFNTIKNEIENNECIPLCSMCHTIEHYTDRKLKDIYIIYKDNLDVLPIVLKEKILNNLNSLITTDEQTAEQLEADKEQDNTVGLPVQ